MRPAEPDTVPASVSVLGLGKLGAPIAACLAARGFRVVGADSDPSRVDLLNRGLAPVHETGLPELLAETAGRLRAMTDVREAVLATDATFVVVPTPSDAEGGFALDFVLRAVEQIGAALREKDAYHLIALTSTVLPGATDEHVIPLLERTSGKRCGTEFGVCYSPEFVALGSVIRDFLEPDFVLIGESDAAAGDRLERIYAAVCRNAPPVSRMAFVNAELAKLAVNTFVTTKISFANMLGELCQRLPGGDVDAVTRALGMDGRIGPRYLKGALPYGGPCFPRDNVALAHLGRTLGARAAIAEATDAFNRELLGRLVDVVAEAAGPDGTVVILGLAYKPGTTVLDEAPGVLLAAALARSGRTVKVHDSLALDQARAVLGGQVRYAPNWRGALGGAAVVVLVNDDPVYRWLTADGLAYARIRAVVDPWRIFRDKLGDDPRFRYFGAGLGPAPSGKRQPEGLAPERRVVQHA